MKYLLDTDHLSIIQRQTGQDYSNLASYMADTLSQDLRKGDNA